MDMPRLHTLVEETCMNAWPAMKEIFYDGWLIRLANGQTRRTNSVNVIGKGSRSLEGKIAYCEDIYRAHGQRPYFRVLSLGPKELDTALVARGYFREDETRTLFMNFRRDRPPDPDRTVSLELHDGRPPAYWLDAHRRLSRRTPEEGHALHAVRTISPSRRSSGERATKGRNASVGFGAIQANILMPAPGRDRSGAA
jgi:hypothetical protein